MRLFDDAWVAVGSVDYVDITGMRSQMAGKEGWEQFSHAADLSTLHDSLGVPMPTLCVFVCGDTGTDPSL